MLTLSEKLKNLMNGLTEELQGVRDWYLKNTNTFAANYLNEESEKKKKTIREKYLAEGLNTQQLLDIELSNLRKKFNGAKYPLLTGSDKTAAELQFAEARYLVNIASETEEVIRAIELALSLGRFDLVSYLHDTFSEDVLRFSASVENTNPSTKDFKAAVLDNEVAVALSKAMDYIIEKSGAKQIKLDLLEVGESSQICAEFIRRIKAGNEYIPFPVSIEVVKTAPSNVVKANLELYNYSLETRGIIKPTNFSQLVSLK